MEPAIHFQQVQKVYGKTQALDALDLRIEPGEIYGFIGPNGAGKSTAIRLMLGFIQAQSGSIRVLGLDPNKDSVALKRQVGYVSSEAFLYREMRARELFQFSAGFHGVDHRAQQDKLVAALDIDLEKRFEELSFGNRKKVAIACALLHKPSLIIMDEPSNGLDPMIRANLYALLQEEQQRGATVFFSSHVLSEVQKTCTRIGLIRAGRLVREADAHAFRDLGYRKVSLSTSADLRLASVPGVSALQQHGQQWQFVHAGRPDDLLRLLASLPLDSILIEEPDLEDVFMHHFQHSS